MQAAWDWLAGACAAAACAVLLTEPVAAEVVVLTNRGGAAAAFAMANRGFKPRSMTIAPGDVIAVPVVGPATLSLAGADAGGEYLVVPNSVYAFVPEGDALRLDEIAFPGRHVFDGALLPRTGLSRSAAEQAARAPSAVVRVKILVDDEEQAPQAQWEAKLRQRLEAASQVINRHCRVQFEVVATGTWESTDGVNDFHVSLREFIAKVNPAPAELAIGFSSQYTYPTGPTRLGGIPGAFFPHLLIREWPQRVSEAERLEVLIHELGHYLGAAHSPELTSSMRAIVGDRQANARDFRLGYDPLNTLVLNLVGEELRTRGTRNLRQLTGATKAQLACLYTTLMAALPDDPTPALYLQAMGLPTAKIEEVIRQNLETQAAGS